MTNLVLLLPVVLLAIALLITIHEFGHFLVAKAFGVHVHVFSVGFGKALLSRRWRGTEYRLSAIPFGGYVRFAGGDPFAEGGTDDDGDERVPHDQLFTSKPPWQRLLINFAGPAVNMALPLFLFTGAMVVGEPQPVARVGEVVAGSAAAAAGIRAGDTVVAVEGEAVRTWPDVEDALQRSAGAVAVEVDRGGETVAFELPGPARYAYGLGLANAAPDVVVGVDHPASPAAKAGLKTGDAVTSVGGEPVHDFVDLELRLGAADGPVTLGLLDGRSVTLAPATGWAEATAADGPTWRRWGLVPGQVVIGGVAEESAALEAGLAKGDRLLRVGDRDVTSWTDITRGVQTAAQGSGEALTTVPIEVTWRRAGQVMTVVAHPAVDYSADDMAIFRYRPLLGVSPVSGSTLPPEIARPYPLVEAVPRAWNETARVGAQMVDLIGKMLTREAAAEKALGGPIAVAGTLYAAASSGIFDLVRTMGFISLSLGIINLVPVPIFDGGQMVMNAAEWLRGRPLPLILRERVQQVGVIFVLVLMFAVVVNDIYRFVSG